MEVNCNKADNWKKRLLLLTAEEAIKTDEEVLFW